MKVRVLLDKVVPAALAHALTLRGIDTGHAQGLKRTGPADAEQPAYAISHRRCLFGINDHGGVGFEWPEREPGSVDMDIRDDHPGLFRLQRANRDAVL